MNSTPHPASTDATSDEDRRDLIIIASLFIAFGGVGVFWKRVTGWLLEHSVILPAGPDVVLALPKADGSGLDQTRVLIAIAAALMLLAIAVSTLAKRRARRIAAETGQVR